LLWEKQAFMNKKRCLTGKLNKGLKKRVGHKMQWVQCCSLCCRNVHSNSGWYRKVSNIWNVDLGQNGKDQLGRQSDQQRNSSKSIQESRNIPDTVQQRKRRCIGYILRHESLYVTQWKRTVGKATRGMKRLPKINVKWRLQQNLQNHKEGRTSRWQQDCQKPLPFGRRQKGIAQKYRSWATVILLEMH